jgi:hypothetical protein
MFYSVVRRKYGFFVAKVWFRHKSVFPSQNSFFVAKEFFRHNGFSPFRVHLAFSGLPTTTKATGHALALWLHPVPSPSDGYGSKIEFCARAPDFFIINFLLPYGHGSKRS